MGLLRFGARLKGDGRDDSGKKVIEISRGYK